MDSETKQPLFGAVFNLYDLKGNLLGEYTTDNRGIIEFPKEVQAGKYKLKEVKAPAGYVLDEMPKTIEVKAGETLELEILNKPMRGQIQIVKTAAENNTITRDKTGALLEGAVFEIYNTRLEVVDRITTDSRGLAVSKELPIGVYGIKEIAAPKYYFTDGTVFYAELKVDGDLVRFEVKNKPKDISVTIEKRGNVQAMPGDVIFYTLDNISNTSNIPLEEFYVHDLLPTDAVRLNQLSTGTWSEKGKFDVLYRTNKKDAYRTLASNLSTTTDNQLECGREALGLAANEYVTDIKLQFAEVGEGFHSVTSPIVTVTVLADLPDGYRFTNRADVGGRTEDEWVYAKDAWTTCIFAPPRGCLPKTGFGG
nr:SpaA isopeptide-forming pilin-related protein [Anaerotruncus sp. G3(2012)]